MCSLRADEYSGLAFTLGTFHAPASFGEVESIR